MEISGRCTRGYRTITVKSPRRHWIACEWTPPISAQGMVCMHAGRSLILVFCRTSETLKSYSWDGWKTAGKNFARSKSRAAMATPAITVPMPLFLPYLVLYLWVWEWLMTFQVTFVLSIKMFCPLLFCQLMRNYHLFNHWEEQFFLILCL